MSAKTKNPAGAGSYAFLKKTAWTKLWRVFFCGVYFMDGWQDARGCFAVDYASS